ncbi:type II toxin-antitoxin system VapC family toxin [Glycomyces xiaoerkulensis]|uniref:type II toxin-antitoxin system VapC family toxin n=1 Tax=Glycomyces xiaoerkulensis TaxID=2038139 RepID=UPI0018E4582E|nr:type II toxin-antitoxin system VapC family toxin [Glycomyces xiaoerkulensis]
MIVLDNSAFVEFLIGDTDLGRRTRKLLLGQEVAAPHVVDLECASVLRRLVRRGVLDEERASKALRLLSRFDLHRFDHTPLLPRIWQLRDNMTAYDASFAALAETLDASLVTVDSKFERTPGLRCRVLNLRADG